MPRKTVPNPAKSDPNLLPMTGALIAMAPYGVDLSYSQLWNLVVTGTLPSVKRRNKIYLVGQPADLAKLAIHARATAGKQGRRKAAA